MPLFKFTPLVAGITLLASISAQAATDLKVWCWDENFNIPAVKLASDIYKKNHPDVTVSIENIEKQDILVKINEALADNDPKALQELLPDIMLMEDYSSRNYVVNYPGFLKDLSGYIDKNNFVDYKTAISSYEDKLYGLPFDSGVSALYIRLDIFEEAGYTFEDFKDLTWEKFINMGRKVRAKTGMPLLPYDPNDLQELRLMLQSAGSWYTDPNNPDKINIANNDVLKESFQHLRRMNYSGLLLPYSGWTQFLKTFKQGKVAAVLSSCWLSPSVESTLHQYGSWRIIPIPKLNNPNATIYSNQGGSQWYVNNHSPRAEEAAKFLADTFGKDHNFINKLIPKIGLISTIKNISVLPNYQKPNKFYNKQLVYMHFTEWNEQIPAVNYGTHTKVIEQSLQKALQDYLHGGDLNSVLQEAQVQATIDSK